MISTYGVAAMLSLFILVPLHREERTNDKLSLGFDSRSRDTDVSVQTDIPCRHYMYFRINIQQSAVPFVVPNCGSGEQEEADGRAAFDEDNEDVSGEC